MAVKFVLKQNRAGTPTAQNSLLNEYFFDGNIFTVGSDAANSLVLPECAPEQFVILPEDNYLMLFNRVEGVQLNGQALAREAFHPLSIGDEIRFENYIIEVADEATADQSENSAPELPAAPQTDIYATRKEIDVPPELLEKYQVSKPPTETAGTRNFAEVLDALRTEEDSFYFTIRNVGAEAGRVLLDHEETPIGANGKSEIAFSIDQISNLFAVARKDWSGILLESKKRNAVFVNDELVETTRRLRNDDQIKFAALSKFSLVLHEPSSLVALESMLSTRVTENGARFGGLAAKRENNLPGAVNSAETVAAARGSFFERRFFGFFSLLEIVTMVIGTLIGAVLFFLFFEVMFS